MPESHLQAQQDGADARIPVSRGSGWVLRDLDPSRWRGQVLTLILRVALIFGPIVYAFSLVAATRERLWIVVAVDTLALAVVAGLYFTRSLPYTARAAAFLAVVYLLSVTLLAHVGPVAQIYLLTASVLTALLLGFWPGVVAIVVSALTLLAAGLLGWSSLSLVPAGYEPSFSAWMAVSLNFALMNTVLTTTSTAVVGALERMLASEKTTRNRLEGDQRQLTEANRALEAAVAERVEAEEALRREQGLARMAADLARVGAWRVAFPEEALHYSDGLYAILGLPPGQPVSVEEALASMPLESASRLRKAIHACVAGEPTFDIELDVHSASGELRHVRAMGSAIRTPDGTVAGIDGAIQDITDFRKTETAIEQLGKELTANLENMTDAFYALDHEWRYTYLNAEGERLLQRSREDLIGKFAYKEYPDTVHGAIGDAFRKAAHERVPVEFEVYYDRLRMWCDARVFPTASGLSVYFRDITERKHAEEALQASEHRFRTVFNQQFQYNAILAPDGCLLEVNDLPLRVADLTRDEVLGRLFWETGWWRGIEWAAEYWRARLTEAAASGEPEFFESEYAGAGGERRIAANALTAIRGDQGNVSWYILQATDITEQRRSEAAARETAALLDIASRIARMGGWVLKCDSRRLYWSEQVHAVHEVPVGETPDLKDAIAFYAPEYRGVIGEAVEACIDRGTPFDIEAELITAKDRRIWVRVIGQAERGEAGAIVRVSGALQDISERKRGESERLALAERLATTLDIITDAFITIDSGWRFTFVNGEAERLLRQSREELLDRHLLEVFPEAVGSVFEERYRHAMDTGESVEFEQDFEPLQATFEVRAHPSPDGLAIYFRDVTERKRARMALRAANDLLERTFESLDVAVLVIERPAGMIIRCNATAEKVFGYAAREMIGRDTAFLHVDEDTREAFERQCMEVIEDGGVFRCDAQVRRKDGKVIHAQHTVSALRDEEGGVAALVSVVDDITAMRRAESERAQLEEQLRQSQKMEAVGRLAGGVAHDFNNMLSVILGHSELLREDPRMPEVLRDDVDEILAAGKRSADLTRQLLAFARKQTVVPRVLAINETIASMLKMLGRLLGEDIDLVWNPGADAGLVRMDPAQIDQILVNLIVNARDAIGGPGRIEISTARRNLDAAACAGFVESPPTPGDYLVLRVRDSGCGMDEATREKLFEPFFTTKPAGMGTGLGLPTVYGIVQQNRGAIEVHSAPGRGAVFQVYLPVHDGETEGEPVTEAPTPPPMVTQTILVVEDEPALLMLATRVLERLGYAVLAAAHPREALAHAAAHDGPIHLLLTDIVMPEMNGVEVWKRIHPDRPEMRCLFMSGYTADALRAQGAADELTHFLQKPFTQKMLAAKVRETLNAPPPGA